MPGRFGFVETRTEELATSAMALDKVDLCGRQINVGRPKGYVEPPGGPAPAAKLGAAQLFAASLANQPTRVLLLENMLKARQLLDDAERTDVRPSCTTLWLQAHPASIFPARLGGKHDQCMPDFSSNFCRHSCQNLVN